MFLPSTEFVDVGCRPELEGATVAIPPEVATPLPLARSVCPPLRGRGRGFRWIRGRVFEPLTPTNGSFCLDLFLGRAARRWKRVRLYLACGVSPGSGASTPLIGRNRRPLGPASQMLPCGNT
jgi:hypothetical protein